MILIADSGSTKTDWRLIDDRLAVTPFTTQGINPYFQSADLIKTIVNDELIAQFASTTEVLAVFFYGAGCGSATKNKVLKEVLLSLFPDATIEVNNDLLAAARAACGTEKGLAAILGTGSNTCYFDGVNIARNIDSLGYVLGDEGSGAHLGKTFIQALLNKELPLTIERAFAEEYAIGKDEILDAIYKQSMPNRYLASYTGFIHKHLVEPTMYKLVCTCFEQFFDKHICKYDNYQTLRLSTIGSVGYYFSDVLKSVAAQKNVTIGSVEKTPIDKLVAYHIGAQKAV
jgi:glucosamine kinase